jgi:SAM-dependent methyltransferase
MSVFGFKDHFSGHATAYADARPRYPDALFSWLASLTAERELVWDCGTGNGQAALGLAAHFRQVIATDPSRQQIESAFPHARIQYRVAAAESPGLEPHSVNLVTAAQAAHWFDRPKFYAQAGKALKPDGAIVVWCYGLCFIEAAIDARLQDFYTGETGCFWPPERRLIDEGYRSIEFPFTPISVPEIQMQLRWTLAQLLAYLRTWSAVQRFMKNTGRDPVHELAPALETLWGDEDCARTVTWPLHIRAGRLQH